VVHLEVSQWYGIQQEDRDVAGSTDLKDADAVQDLAPSAQAKAEANGGWDDKQDLDKHGFCDVVSLLVEIPVSF
jgi:hypothetical protein